jgi:hypothetical protein
MQRVNTVEVDKLFIPFKCLRFDLNLDFFRFCLFFFRQGDLQASLTQLGNEFFRINLVVDSKAPDNFFSELIDAIIVFIDLRILLPIAPVGQDVVMKINRNVFLGHARNFCFQMNRVVLFNHIDLGLNCRLLLVCPREREKPIGIE